MRVTLALCALGLIFAACDKQDAKSDSGSAQTKETKSDADGPTGAFSKYKAKSMASEARASIRRITVGARTFYEEERVDPANPLAITAKSLPPSAPMTPPAGSCCKQPEGTCTPNPGQWDHEGWKAVMFEMSSPHRYSYEMKVDGDTVTVRAVGDLDCDGNLSTYESVGTVKDGALEFTPKLTETNPLE